MATVGILMCIMGISFARKDMARVAGIIRRGR